MIKSPIMTLAVMGSAQGRESPTHPATTRDKQYGRLETNHQTICIHLPQD